MALMTAHALSAHAAYGTAGRDMGSDSDIEIQVFRTAISKLRPLTGPDFKLTPDAARTLSENLKLWDILTADIASPDNTLADALAAQLISLGLFVRNHTLALYRGEGSADVLVDINTAVLKGLMGQPGTATATQAA
ncbi:MAG: flagellar biosynthesis regulator FlaF [Litorimonas sp.]